MKVVAGQAEKENLQVLQVSEWVGKSGQPTGLGSGGLGLTARWRAPLRSRKRGTGLRKRLGEEGSGVPLPLCQQKCLFRTDEQQQQ